LVGVQGIKADLTFIFIVLHQAAKGFIWVCRFHSK
jgi:hypothetical protein